MSWKSSGDELEFRQIVLLHIKRILEISTHELKDSSRRVIAQNLIETIEKEDTRYSYIQSIENLAYVLLPYFDETIKKVYDESIPIINMVGFQIRKKFEKEYKEFVKGMSEKDIKHWFVIRKKLEYAKKLFLNLNLLLHRNNYLKVGIYGDTADDSDDEIVYAEEVKETIANTKAKEKEKAEKLSEGKKKEGK